MSITSSNCTLVLILLEKAKSWRNRFRWIQRVSGSSVTTVDPRTNTSLTYSEYLMIPFAAPPVGELRFRPPVPPQPWSDPPQVTWSQQINLLTDSN